MFKFLNKIKAKLPWKCPNCGNKTLTLYPNREKNIFECIKCSQHPLAIKDKQEMVK